MARPQFDEPYPAALALLPPRVGDNADYIAI
jgi:hypothetical protein